MKEVITEIEINASPDKVWQVFSANDQWEAWNPFIIKSVGALVVGQKVANTLTMKGQKPMTIKPTVLKAESAKELRWIGHLLFPGIFDGEHYFKLEATAKGTRFVHGEIFKGILIGIVNMDDVKSGFEALNVALKKRVEG